VHNWRVTRRTAVLLALALTVTGAVACSADDPPAVPVPSPTSPVPAPAPSSAPAEVTGTAPDREFEVATLKLTFSNGKDRPLPTTVWYPADGDGPFPLVLFSHGLTSEPPAYRSVLSAWARAGFVVAAPAYPFTSYRAPRIDPVDIINQPADASLVITRMLALNGKPGGKLSGRIDPDRVAAAGHSAGGITTVGMFSGNRDDRLKAGIVLSGRLGLPVPFSGEPAPILFVHGKLDKTVRFAEGLSAFDAVPWPKAMMSVTRGGHVAITKDFPPVLDTTTDFLRYALYGDTAAKDRLKADATRGGRASFKDDL
jgi:dienelactone hydrolase